MRISSYANTHLVYGEARYDANKEKRLYWRAQGLSMKIDISE